jgi:RsiW-degrading membrane proteinase PrsW (M82 family)
VLLTILIAIAIPIIFLYSVHWLDLYGSDRPRTVLICFVWGLVAFLLAVLVNRFCTDILGWPHDFVGSRTAPFVEEVFKSLILIYLVRRANFTYFVDGAIYGFASGIGFAVIENLRYIMLFPDQAFTLVIMRDFSTALMHGTATGLTGVALGRFRLARGSRSGILSLLLGWAGAMTLHYTFNNIAISTIDSATAEFLLVAIGLSGVALVALIILWGLREERQWLREELGEKLHVSAEEASIVQHMGDLDDLLAPIEKRFGNNKRKQVATFLHLEAQIGLKQEAVDKAADPILRAELAEQVAQAEQELDGERRRVGMYVMSFVRVIMPPTDWSLWARLGQTLTKTQEPRVSIWSALAPKLRLSQRPPGEGIYGSVQAELDARAKGAALTMTHVNELPDKLRQTMHWVMKEESVGVHHVVAGLGHEEAVAKELLSHLVSRGFLHQTTKDGQVVYRSRLTSQEAGGARPHVWQSLEKKLLEQHVTKHS